MSKRDTLLCGVRPKRQARRFYVDTQLHNQRSPLIDRNERSGMAEKAHIPALSKLTQQKPRGPRKQRPNYAAIHSRSLPVELSPLPAIIPHNPLTLLRVAYLLLSEYFKQPTSHLHSVSGYYSKATRSVHVTDQVAIRFLWERGFFGKGSLSRSEPEWLERERQRISKLEGVAGPITSADVTEARRQERREGKRERARLERLEIEKQLVREGKLPASISESATSELNGHASSPTVQQSESTSREDASSDKADKSTVQATEVSEQSEKPDVHSIEIINQEHLQLAPYEAFFLAYGLGILNVLDRPNGESLSNRELLQLFRRISTFPPLPSTQKLQPDDSFMLSYVVYHHYRSLGWVVRPGIKFAVDFLLYNRGPAFSHAEFAILILPSYKDEKQAKDHQREWWWLHGANRVQNQVRKALVIVYVEVPSDDVVQGCEDIGAMLKAYKVQDFVIRRWSANRNRD